MASKHEWRFFRAGGFDQVRISSGADMLALDELDQKLWVALSCPAHGIEFDAHTLELIDTDGDGHVRAPEVIAAVKWAGSVLKDSNWLIKGVDTLPLSAINEETEEGRKLLAAARHILTGLGKPDAESICPEDVADTRKLMAALPFNGDGVVLPGASDDASVNRVMQEIMDCLGSVEDRGGEGGVSEDTVKSFFEQARTYATWWSNGADNPEVFVLGAQSLDALAAFQAVKTKVDDYFTRCRMAEYDPRAAMPLSRSLEDYQLLAGKELGAATAELAGFPLATVGAGQSLPLDGRINPAWSELIDALKRAVVQPLLGAREALSQAEWQDLTARFAPLESWMAQKPQTVVECLGAERIQAICAGTIQSVLEEMIVKDKALAEEVEAIASVDRLLYYCRDLNVLVNNFVSFNHFYTGEGKATFQAGTLYLDGRSCELCVKVEDVNKHAVLANLSRVCLVYCECTRKGGAEKMTIAAAFTAGDSDQLMVGRNGVFYDRKGNDWDATIVRILEHPISIRQAFWAPYKRIGKMVGEQLQKLAAARSQAVESKMTAATVEAAHKHAEAAKPGAPVPAPAPAAPPTPFDISKFAGVFAAIGLAVGALGTALASVVTGLLNLKWWQMPLAVLGAFLIVSGPSMLIAWFKLKQRNLGPILDATGWAVNARARINIAFGKSLTGEAVLPGNAARHLVDPFADKKSHWPFYVGFLLLVALAVWVLWRMGIRIDLL